MGIIAIMYQLASPIVAVQLLAAGLVALAGCASAQVQSPGPGEQEPAISEGHIVAGDGYQLPLSRWLPDGEPERVVLALHGFNDFRQSHRVLAERLRQSGSAVYAYDQRGFGATEQRGIWPGSEQLVDDAVLALELLSERHPDTPLYLLGESMGAAVALLVVERPETPPLEGTVLMAPAVWALEEQPWYQRAGLWLGMRINPDMKVASKWVDVEPTDDPEWREYWDEHPLVLHRSRMDTLEGLSRLMGDALAAASELELPALILYGGEDEVIPPEAICTMVATLPPEDSSAWEFIYYPDGWHFLTRDSRADETLADIAAWLKGVSPLPSGKKLQRQEALNRLCD